MTEFNPLNKPLEELSFGDVANPAMEITNQADADQYLEKYARSITSEKMGYEESLKTARHNLAYYAGYYSNSVRERVEKLFSCEHPFFGSIKRNGPPTSKQAFEIGKNFVKDGNPEFKTISNDL